MSYSLVGIGSAILDILVNVDDDFVLSTGLSKSSATIVDAYKQEELLTKIEHFPKVFASGGSIANTVLSYAQAGGSSALVSCFSDDALGIEYLKECTEKNVNCYGNFLTNTFQGTCICLITPDGERTMQVNLGVCANFSLDTIKESPAGQQILFEGYLLFNPSGEDFLNYCLSRNVILSLSDINVVNYKRDFILSALPKLGMLVGNEQEVFALFAISTMEELMAVLKLEKIPALITLGEKGSFYFDGTEFIFGKAVPTSVIDLTGAGDMFLAVFLRCRAAGVEIEDALNMAANYASRVISQIGARLSGNIAI